MMMMMIGRGGYTGLLFSVANRAQSTKSGRTLIAVDVDQGFD
jgi:hypothetical protein